MASGPGQQTKEYSVKVSKSAKKYHALKFSATNDAEFKNNSKAELAREGGHYQYKAEWESLPKAGTGSEFNRENKEMARRKKFGFNSKGHSIDDMPWILTNKTAAGKEIQYRAKRSVSDNSSYFVFIKSTDNNGGFEAHPLEDWYTFAPYRTYKTLTIEEAEEEFSRRHKTLNKYAIMANRRKAKDDMDDEGPGGSGGGSGRSGKASASANDDDDDMSRKKTAVKKVLSDMIMSGDEENLSDDDEEGSRAGGSDDEKSKSRKKGRGGGDDDGDEMKVNEDSDDGDHEGDEVDYSSNEEEGNDSDFEQTKNVEKYEEKGIDEDAAMKALETEESEDEEEKNLTEEGKLYKKLISQTMKDDDEASKDSAKKSAEANSSDSSDMEDPDNDPNIVSTLFDNKKNFLNANSAFNDSPTSATSTGKSKRKATDEVPEKASASKRKATDDVPKRSTKESSEDTKAIKANLIRAATASASTPTTPSLMFEDEVVHYLKRKPMTIKELINKFKKKTTMSSNELSNHLSKIFNKLKELKGFTVEEKNGIKYLSLYAPAPGK